MLILRINMYSYIVNIETVIHNHVDAYCLIRNVVLKLVCHLITV